MTRIKICGITSIADARLAIDAGADYLGLIFVEDSPRKIDMDTARQIFEQVQGQIQLIGVFKDQSVEFVHSISRIVPLHMVQLHGAETADYCSAMLAPVIRAFCVTPEFEWTELDRWKNVTAAVLLDRFKESPDPGWLDWALSAVPSKCHTDLPVFFAGGLTAQNVRQVVEKLHPFAVDVASGVESKAGKKDEEKVRMFCNAVKQGAEGAIVG